MLRDRLGVSERWACRVVGQHRSTQRHEPKRADDDAALRAELRKFSVERPRWGYRRAHHRLRELGWEVNRKRVQRLWREEGLRVPQRKRKRRRLGESLSRHGRTSLRAHATGTFSRMLLRNAKKVSATGVSCSAHRQCPQAAHKPAKDCRHPPYRSNGACGLFLSGECGDSGVTVSPTAPIRLPIAHRQCRPKGASRHWPAKLAPG